MGKFDRSDRRLLHHDEASASRPVRRRGTRRRRGSVYAASVAALAEKERALISQRTKAALSAAKARGQKLGNPNLSAAREVGAAVLRANADRRAANVLPIIAEIQTTGATTLRAIADALNKRGILTPRGRQWEAMSVKNALARV
jgi:DNA invertase Pin-like site-specific DNA recombinase